MTPSVPVPPPFRANVLLSAVAVLVSLGATVPDATAAGRNHDMQVVRIPAEPPASHDHAPGPGLR